MELDLQSLFGLLCTAVLIGRDPVTPPPFTSFGLMYEGAIGQPREGTALCNPLCPPIAGPYYTYRTPPLLSGGRRKRPPSFLLTSQPFLSRDTATTDPSPLVFLHSM
jgi:hypothetical protein